MVEVNDGGLQYVPQIAVQYVYLDFDGELTSYNGEILTIDGVEVRDSKLTQARITDIVAELNAKYAAQNVIFVTERPATAEYSSIYIGKTDAFSSYGNFAGLAENIDSGNQNKTDKAFVMLDSSASNEAIISTISHETDHLLGTLDHGGEGLQAYAYGYWVNQGETSNNKQIYKDDFMTIYPGGKAIGTIISSGGEVNVLKGGSAIGTVIKNGGSAIVYYGAFTDSTTILSGGYILFYGGGTPANIFLKKGGICGAFSFDEDLHISSSINLIYIDSGTCINGNILSVFDGSLKYHATVHSGGSMHILNAGIVTSTTVNQGGLLTVSNGGNAIEIIENGGYVSVASGADVSFALNVISGLTLKNDDKMTVHLYTTADQITIDSGGAMYLEGGFANNTVVNSNGCLHINNLGEARDITVNNDGNIYINDGFVTGLKIAAGGRIGGFSFDEDIFFKDTQYTSVTVTKNVFIIDSFMYLTNGGRNSNVSINCDACMIVSSGGIAGSTSVNTGGTMYISQGGIADSTSVNTGGTMYISQGGIVDNVIVNTGGELHIYSGGCANNVIVNTGGELRIYNGGCADIVFNPWQGSICSSSGAIVNYLDRDANIYYGKSLAEIVSKFDSSTEFQITSYNSAIIYSNGVMDSANIDSNGTMHISSGGIANNTSVNSLGTIYVSHGGITNNTTINANGTIYVFSAGIAHSTLINSSATMYISQGATACDTIINANGILYILPTGIASNVTVNNGGSMIVSSDGTAVEIIENGGYVNVTEGADVSFISNTIDQLELRSAAMTVHKNTVAKNTAVENNGRITIFSGGEAVNTVVYSTGRLSVLTGGIASNTKLSGYNSHINKFDNTMMYIYSGGIANEITLGGYGDIYVSSGGIASSALIKSLGKICVADGGIASKTTVTDRGNIDILSGGTARDTLVADYGRLFLSSGAKHCGTLILNNNAIVSACSGAIIDFTLTGHSATDTALISNLSLIDGNPDYTISVEAAQTCGIYQLAYRTNTFSKGIKLFVGNNYCSTLTVDCADFVHEQKRYRLTLFNNNLALTIQDEYIDFVKIYSSGTVIRQDSVLMYEKIWGNQNNSVHISSGGILNSATVYSGGCIYISNGGVANNTNLSSGGDIIISNGGVANNTIVNSYCDLFIRSGGSAKSVIINNNGRLNVANSGSGSDVIVNDGGFVYVSSGGIAMEVKENGGYVHVQDGANITFVSNTLSQEIVTYLESMTIHSNTVATSTTVNSSGCIFIYGGGIANNTVNFGNMYIFSGGMLNNTIVNSSALMYVSGGIINDTIINSSGKVYISSGGKANNNIVGSFGYISVFSGGMMNDNTISAYGSMVVAWGGNAKNTTVHTGGIVHIVGKHYGSLQIESEATVLADRGSIIDFSVATQKITDDYLINHLSLISGAPTYTITVDSNQAYGVYKLAQGARYFNETISIGDGVVNYGLIAVNGKDLLFNGITYSLKQLKGNLTLEIKDITPPDAPIASVAMTTATNNDVAITATYSADSVVREYKIGDGEWLDYTGEITVSENGTVYFRAKDAVGNESTGEITVSNIDKAAPEIPSEFTETVSGYDAAFTWTDSVDNAGMSGYCFRYGSTENLDGEGEFVSTNGFTLNDLAVGSYYYQVRGVDLAGNMSEWSAVREFAVIPGEVQDLSGSIDGLSWASIAGVGSYAIELTGGSGSLDLETANTAIDFFALPAGTFQWQVKAENGVFTAGNAIVSENSSEPQLLSSEANGDMDLFFGNASGIWEDGYFAEHQGILNGWNGTGEQVELLGKNKISDVFSGSDDANILVLTDDANGDALFVEDVYTSFGKDAARIAQIDEIRAGAGDDIIDLTSQKFAYDGDGVKICGGLGNDTIWANNGNNTLFGDAGNDRIIGGSGNDVIVGGIGNDSMHGGGGEDIFCFGSDWGVDTVEQLSDGKVTLCFADGEVSNWNADTLTYTDGANSVTVSGVSAENITLNFGNETSLPAGAFSDAASVKIFEDKKQGMLA
ncbi:MAG: hypothetical protein E7057_00180 [Lentisphaerae bacterium]|nr:hypothetical protein [Lentisphaerota bacterium]